jgi:CHASE3 domain sensor protein
MPQVLFCESKPEGQADAFRRRLTVIPFVMGTALLAAIVLWRIWSHLSAATWVEQSDEVILHTKDAEIQLRDVQLAMRDYLLLTDIRCLTEVNNGQKEFAQSLARIADVAVDKPEQEQRLLELGELKRTWIKSIERLVRQNQRMEFSPEAFIQVRAQAQAVFTSLEDVISYENQLRAQRKAKQRRKDEASRIMLQLIAIMALGLLLASLEMQLP